MRFYIETYGCQMNEYDSQLAEYELLRSGHEKCSSPEEADLVIFNTCTVRKSAEDRVYGQLGHMKRHKKERNILVGVIGCMAQKSGQSLIDEVPHVDFVLGTDHLDDITHVVRFLQDHPGEKKVLTDQNDSFLETEELPRKKAQLSEFISIMRAAITSAPIASSPMSGGGNEAVTRDALLKRSPAWSREERGKSPFWDKMSIPINGKNTTF